VNRFRHLSLQEGSGQDSAVVLGPDNSYTDLYKTPHDPAIGNKKPRLLQSNGVLPVSPYFPSSMVIRDGTSSMVIHIVGLFITICVSSQLYRYNLEIHGLQEEAQPRAHRKNIPLKTARYDQLSPKTQESPPNLFP
jgi:hypothetical protein